MRVLVLSGGVARGFYQLGCLEQLVANGQTWEGIVVTSVGALNGAGLSMLGVEAMKRVWLSIKEPQDIIKRHWLIEMPWKRGIYSLNPLKALLERELAKSPTGPTIPFWVGVCDLGNISVGFRPHGPDLKTTIKHVIASSSMPVLMDPVDDMLVDGGVRDIVPMSFPIRELGATEITVISCSPYSRNQMADGIKWSPKFPKIIGYLTRTIEAMTAEIQWQDMELCKMLNDVPGMRSIKAKIYAPDHKPILDALDFHKDLIQRAYDLGKAMATNPVMSFGW